MAPNNAFSWHLCGAYKTFTMANMAPQRDHLNRVTWERLEAQVLYWGVKLGPVYEVTGPIMAQPDEPLQPSSGIVRPTGFFKVIYRPATESEDEQAGAFLVPHTHERGLSFWSFIATVRVVEAASGLEFGFEERLKRGGRQRFWLKGWFPELARQERLELCAG